MKKILIILTLAGFMLPALLVPYGNFEDTRSLQAVYNYCLARDADMDFIEFVGEKMLAAGIDPYEQKEDHSKSPNKPVEGAPIVQIHAGVFAPPSEATIEVRQPETAIDMAPFTNTAILKTDFCAGIFHPPLTM